MDEPDEPRPLTIEDLPWALALAWKRYPPFHPGAAVNFYQAALKTPTALKLRCEHAFLIGNIVTPAWRPDDHEFHMLVLCAVEAHHWDAIKLLRESVQWARSQGCKRWWFSSDTTYEVEALCRRIGATRQMRYRIEL